MDEKGNADESGFKVKATLAIVGSKSLLIRGNACTYVRLSMGSLAFIATCCVMCEV